MFVYKVESCQLYFVSLKARSKRITMYLRLKQGSEIENPRFFLQINPKSQSQIPDFKNEYQIPVPINCRPLEGHKCEIEVYSRFDVRYDNCYICSSLNWNFRRNKSPDPIHRPAFKKIEMFIKIWKQFWKPFKRIGNKKNQIQLLSSFCPFEMSWTFQFWPILKFDLILN